MFLTEAEIRAAESVARRHSFTQEDARQLVAEVADLFGVTVEQILSNARREELVDARTVIAHALLTRGQGPTFIGITLQRHHSSVYNYRARARGMKALRELSAEVAS